MTYTPPLTNIPSETSNASAAPVAGFLSSIARPLRAMLKASQYGQMVRVLRQMPDSTLTEIGIKRSDIPDYARSLFEDR